MIIRCSSLRARAATTSAEPRRPTQEIAMTIHRTILAAAFTLASTGAAHADELQPLQARSIDLGEMAGVAYYIVERDGFRLVAILAQGVTGTPVRFETVLAPGQSVVLPPRATRASLATRSRSAGGTTRSWSMSRRSRTEPGQRSLLAGIRR